MEQKAEFHYFYGEEADMHSFYRIPKLLFTNDYFKALSNDAKILYGLMLDRMSLSMKNQWFDEENKAYIYFSVEDIMELLNCGKNKAVKTMQELDRETGTVAEGEPKAPETGKTDIEQLNKRLSEMSAVVKICGALDRKDVVGWNEETQAVTITDDERTLVGKEVYDFLFAEAADYVMMQTISGETEKALEMDGLLKDARQYASRYADRRTAFDCG